MVFSIFSLSRLILLLDETSNTTTTDALCPSCSIFCVSFLFAKCGFKPLLLYLSFPHFLHGLNSVIEVISTTFLHELILLYQILVFCCLQLLGPLFFERHHFFLFYFIIYVFVLFNHNMPLLTFLL